MSNSALKRLAALGLSLLMGLSLAAQPKVTVSGTVVDDQNEPMIGVGVFEKGTTNGVVTDLDGNYSISVPAGATLVFSSVGFTTQEVVVSESGNVDIKLVTDA